MVNVVTLREFAKSRYGKRFFRKFATVIYALQTVHKKCFSSFLHVISPTGHVSFVTRYLSGKKVGIDKFKIPIKGTLLINGQVTNIIAAAIYSKPRSRQRSSARIYDLPEA